MLLTAASCAPRAIPVTPPVEAPERFSASGDLPPPERWWTAFGDPGLQRLVDKALGDNFSLRAAWDRLDQARAAASRAGAPLWPDLDLAYETSRTMSKEGGDQRRYRYGYNVGLAVNYEIDLWGRVRSASDAARLDAYASQEDVYTAAVTLTSEIARAWYTLVEQRGQLTLLDEQIATNEKVLEVITQRFRGGKVSATDVLQQREVVQRVKGQRVLVESAIAVLEHRLAILAGEPPIDAGYQTPAVLPPVPPLPETGLPAELLRRRPDVRAAELRVQSADRRVWSAIADRFPRLGLSIDARSSAGRFRDLIDNWFATLAGNMLAPLLDGGLRAAEVERTRAVLSERINNYGQEVLAAWGEVEDALVQEEKQRAFVASLDKQLDLSSQASEQTLDRYTRGTGDFTRYLTTLLSYQQLQRTALQARRDRILFRIDLHRALAGGFALPRPPRQTLEGDLESVDDPAIGGDDDEEDENKDEDASAGQGPADPPAGESATPNPEG